MQVMAMQATRRSDTELLAATAREPEAFGEFYRRHAEAVLAYLLYRTREPQRALDLAAEVFAAALKSRGSYDPRRGPARAWLFGIARNTVAESNRREAGSARARRRLGMERLSFEDSELARVEELIDLERSDVPVALLLAGLPEHERAAVQARVVDEEEYSEIAAREGVSNDVIRQRVSRGLGRLGSRLKGDKNA